MAGFLRLARHAAPKARTQLANPLGGFGPRFAFGDLFIPGCANVGFLCAARLHSGGRPIAVVDGEQQGQEPVGPNKDRRIEQDDPIVRGDALELTVR